MTARPGAVAGALGATARVAVCCVVVGLLAAVTSCGPRRAAAGLADMQEASLHVTLSESVAWRGKRPSKSLRLVLNGAPRAESDGSRSLALRVAAAELIYRDAEGAETRWTTDGSAEEPEPGDSLGRARRAILELLLRSEVVLELDPVGALAQLTGLDAAVYGAHFASGGGFPDGVSRQTFDVALDGVRTFLDDAAVTDGLRDAGFAPAPEGIGGQDAEIRRDVHVRVDGRGQTTVACFGRPGFGGDGSPTVRCEGQPDDAPAFTGDPGVEPPPPVGPVRVAHIRATSESEYDRDSLRPLRGSVVVELPHEGGPVATRGLEFLFLVLR